MIKTVKSKIVKPKKVAKKITKKENKKEIKKNPSYFSGVNYSLGNEDTSFEYALQQKLNPKKILSVCGSGSRFLPFLAMSDVVPEKIVAVDLSVEQLQLTQLKMETYRSFDYDQFLLFWGFPPYEWRENAQKRKLMFEALPLKDQKIRDLGQSLLERSEYQSIIYSGKWEQTFRKISKLARRTLASNFHEIFECKNLKEQREFFQKKFTKARLHALLLLLGNATLFNSLLYKGSFVNKNIDESYYGYYTKAFDYIMENLPVRENFFMQLCLFGHIICPEGIPIDSRPHLFPLIKDNLLKAKTQIELVQGDLVGVLKSYGEKAEEDRDRFDFVSLSDVPSYFSGDLEKNFMQEIRGGVSDGGVLVLRSYLKVPECNLKGFKEITNKFKKEISREGLQMYRIQVFQKIG